MADCSTLLDEELESFVFNYLTDSPGPGEEPLSLDFPEIDLSQLDASDFDSNSCFNELQWCNDHSENESSQYSTDDSELFQIIDSENEALLAALTQTLDDIQEDDISLSAFISSGDGDFCPLPILSPKPSLLAESPYTPEAEDELSILKKLLLSPAQVPVSCDGHKDGSSRRQGASKFRPPRACSKVESPTDRKPGFPQAQSRSCIELHRHLMSTQHVAQASASYSKEDSQDSTKEEDSDFNEDEQSDYESVNALQSLASEDRKPQFACEREKRAVVDLIRYMHTYCLPIKNLAHHTEEKHQHCNSLLKTPKLNSTLQIPSCPSQGRQEDSIKGKKSCPAAGKVKQTRSTLAGVSILKELLAKDISGDVSKPYRLAQPVYAAFSSSCGSRFLQGKAEQDGAKGSINTALVKPQQSCSSLKKENVGIEQDLRKPANIAQEHVTIKMAPKQENSVYAVRRSSRLNPEFSEWLWFDEESSPQICVAQGAVNIELTPAAPAFCLTSESLGHGDQMSEVEMGELDETNGLVQLNRTVQQRLQDVKALEGDASEAHNDIVPTLFHSQENPRCPPLSLSQNDSAFEKRDFEQALTVELCGTAGLTPPTTPPYKPAEEDLYKPEINQGSVKSESLMTSSKVERTEETLSIDRKLFKKHPERTELYAYLSRTAGRPDNSESQGVKRPYSRTFGDHDYCQVKKSETALQRKVLKSLDLTSHVERKPKQPMPTVQQSKVEKKTERPLKEGSKLLKDHEIRASLTKHFGSPDNSLKEKGNAICNGPEYDSVFEDSGSECCSPLEDEVCSTPFRTKMYSRRSPPSKANPQHYSRSLTSSRSSCHSSPDSRRTFRCESSEQRQTGNLSQRQIQKRTEKAIHEGRVIYIRNLSNSMSANELKRRFEAFGEIIECRVLGRSRGEKYGFITYRSSEHAALSLKKGASLRKRNEPSFQLSYGGLRHIFWTKYTDLDSNAEAASSPLMKSKYESMDFDSLLKEAQRSLHR